MKSFLKRIVVVTKVHSIWRSWASDRAQAQALTDWEKNGRPAPPPHLIKQKAIRAYAEQFGLTIFVETGTCYGDMVAAVRSLFARIYSIELSPVLFERCKERFKGFGHIQLICGDSATKLNDVLSVVDKPALFWLDGHYSGGVTALGDKETPIVEEVLQILAAPDLRHVIMIDDARCFGTDPAYPTIQELSDLILSKRSGVSIVVENDSIRILPQP